MADTTTWAHRTLHDAAELDARPPEMDAARAQPWCNFTIFTPEVLPRGTELTSPSVRREAPPGRVGDATAGRTPWSTNNPAAFRFEVRGVGRRLRVKQFLYDWAFPALDQPALWESHTSADVLDNDHVVWHGADYMGNTASSARIARTTIELSVLRGTFEREEITDLYRALRPADASVATRVAATPFAALSYWARRPDAPAISVPIGAWDIRQPDTMRVSWRSAEETGPLTAARSVPRTFAGLAMDSVGTHSAPSPISEEIVYSGGAHRGTELRLHTLNPAHVAPTVNPEPHPSQDETLTIHGRRVRLGWIDDDHGPFDAVIHAPATDTPEWRLLSSADAGTGREWFMAALEGLLA